MNDLPKDERADGLSVATGSAVLWSQAFSDDTYHAIPRAEHDPRASGWIAKCGAFCCGAPIAEEKEELRGHPCPKCLEIVRPVRYGAYWMHPDGWYRLFPPNAKAQTPESRLP